VAVLGLLFAQLSGVKAAKYSKIKPTLDKAVAKDQQFTTAFNAFKEQTNHLGQLQTLTADKYYWIDTLPELRKVLLKVEQNTSNKWNSASGIWIEQFVTPAGPDATPGADFFSAGQSLGAQMEQAIEQRYNIPLPAADAAGGPTAAASPAVGTIFVVCRAMKGPNETANSELMYAVFDAFKACPLVDPKTTQLGERLLSDDALSQYTFTFAMKVTLAKPLTLKF
jgi:hypothetical protein